MAATNTRLIAAAAALLAAGSAPAQHTFIKIADTEAGFAELLSASLNDAGTIVFAATTVGAPDGGVYRVQIELPTITRGPEHVAGDADLSAVGPVINDHGWIAFVGTTIADLNRAVWLVKGAGDDPDPLIDQAAGGFDLVGQLAINSPPAAADTAVAFWSLALGSTNVECLRTIDNSGGDPLDIECPADLGCSLTGPAINASVITSYIRSCNDGTRTLQVYDGVVQSALPVGPDGLISSPSINDGGTSVVYAADVGNPDVPAPGIYTIGPPPALTVTQVVNFTDQGLSAAVNTSAFINDHGDVAFLAAGSREGIYTTDDPASPVIAAGDLLDDAPIQNGTLELFGFNDCGQILFSARVGAKRVSRDVIALAITVDLDGDGAVDIDDFLQLLAAWGPNPGHPADFDCDGEVGILDFMFLIANWG